jgi:hypothetical protein
MRTAAVLVAALWVGELLSGCKTSPPRPPVCDGKTMRPVNGRATAAPVAQTERDDGGCQQS